MPAAAISSVPNVRRQHAATILQRSVCLTLSCHWLGNDRKIDAETMVKAVGDGNTVKRSAEDAFSATMRLIDPKKLRPIRAMLGQAKAYLKSRAIPTPSIFGERSYLIPLALVEEVDRRLTELQRDIRAASVDLSESYNTHVAAQAVKLGNAFDAKRYPTKDQVADAFAIEWDYHSFNAPDQIDTVDHALFLSIQRKNDAKMASAFEEVKVVLRETLREFVATVAEKLTPDTDGKPKIFRNTIMRDVTEFIGTFQFRNISDDAELERIVARLRRLTSGVDPDALRDADDLRANVLAGMRAAATELDGLIVKGRRGISFGGI